MLWTGLVFGQSSPSLVIDSLMQQSKDLTEKENYEGAIELLKKVLLLPVQDSLLLAQVHHQIGIIYYQSGDSQTEFEYAQQYLLKALDIRERQDLVSDKEFFRSYYALANLYYNYKNFEKGIGFGEKAARLMENAAQPNYSLLAKAYYLLSVGYEETGDQDKALSFGNQALQGFKRLDDQISIIRSYNQLGLVHLARKEYEQAIDYFQIILALPHLPERYLAQANSNLGLVHEKRNDSQRAIQTYLKAKTINEQVYRQEKSAYRHLAIAGNLKNIAVIYTRLKRYSEAQQALEEARKVYLEERQTEYHPDIAEIYDNLGDNYALQSNYHQAIQYYHQGILSLVPDFKNKTPTANPDLNQHRCYNKNTLLTLLRSKANSFYQWHLQNPQEKVLLENAFHCYLHIDSLLTQIRQNIQSTDSRYALIEKVIPIYERALQTSLLLYRQNGDQSYLEEAYRFCIKNKAIVFLEGLQEDHALYSGVPNNLLLEEETLQKAYLDAETALYDFEIGQSSASIDSLEEALFQAKRNHDKLILQLEKKYPRYYDLKYAYNQKIDLDFLRDQLPKDALLVEFFVGVEQIFTFTLSSKGLDYFQIDKPLNFEADCTTFRQWSAENSLAPRDQKHYHQLAFQLYNWLLADALKSTSDAGVKRLFIVPDGQLLRVSFDHFFFQSPDQWAENGFPYLIKKYATSIAYSSKFFFDPPGQRRKTAQKYFAGFGLEYDTATLAALNHWQQGSSNPREGQGQVGKLIYSPQEVSNIARLFDGDYWINEKATKRVFLENAGYYQILHLATHGLEVLHKPLNSALAFTQTEPGGDFLLRAADLYSLDLHADLVTLSACDTGHGKLSKGEGIQSLARAFAYAGSPSILASLWSASDASNNDILLSFYQNLKKGQSKDVALQQAKLQYLEENATYASPAYWANLVIIGSPNPLPQRRNWMLPVVGILLLLAALFAFRRRFL